MTVAAMWSSERRIRLLRPLFVARVCAGFPSPAEDWVEGRLDLNQHLIRHPAATFYVRVTGDSMRDAHINDGDILIVDRACEVEDGDIIIARIFTDFVVRRLSLDGGRLLLLPANDAYQPIEVNEGTDFEVWGKVTWSFRPHGNPR